MSANKEKCADREKSVCDYNEYRRLRYFHGMLLDDNDFQAEQEYHAGKRRMLNRTLHGSGVVCGLDLNGKKDGRWIEVTSGLALDCGGNEIWVPRKLRIDLEALLPPKDHGKKQGECLEDEEDDSGVKTYYIGIRYDEKPSNPVSVYLPSASCEDRPCENSRYKEGFCVEIVQCCVEKHPPGLLQGFCECGDEFKRNPDDSPLCTSCGDLAPRQLCKCLKLEEFCEQSVPCPECCSCDEPCHVILGKIQVNKECRLETLCINECRRYVLTGRMLQHMLTGVLTGAEKYFYMKTNGGEIQIPDASELARNPFKALYWWLRYKVIGDGEFKVNLCAAPQAPNGGNENAETASLRTQLETDRQEYKEMLAELKLRSGATVAVVDSGETPSTEVKPQADEPKKASTPRGPKGSAK